MGRSQRASSHPRHSIPTQQNHTNPSILPTSLIYHSLSQKDSQSTIIENALFLTSLPYFNLGNVYSVHTVQYSLSPHRLIISDCTVPVFTACDHIHKVLMMQPATTQTTGSISKTAPMTNDMERPMRTTRCI